MKRSRSGCQTCRARRIKCDEGRPICKNCLKRGLCCTYEIKYQWIAQDDFGAEYQNNSAAESPKNSEQCRHNASPQVVDTECNACEAKPKKRKLRQGPTSRKRKIGQSVINGGCFNPTVLKNLKTVMKEVEFNPDDEPITVLNGPGSLTQFKKFKIYRLHSTRKAAHLRLPSPLRRPAIYNTMGRSENELDFPQPSKLLKNGSYYAKPSGALHETLSPLYHDENGRVRSVQQTQPLHAASAASAASASAAAAAAAANNNAGPPSTFGLGVGRGLPPISSVSPSAIFSEPSNSLLARRSNANNETSLSGLRDQDFFDHFIDVTADALVPIPYEENPFLSLLPKLATSDSAVWDVLVTYGASHRAMLMHGLNSDPVDDAIVDQLIARCTAQLAKLRQNKRDDERALLVATLLAMIEVDRGNPNAWHHFMCVALDIIRSRLTFSDWQLDVEINSMSFRLVGYMSGIGSMFSSSEKILDFPSWPQWSGSLDYLTGIDLNLLPMFSEAAELVVEVERHEHEWTMTERAAINIRALRIIQRMNDYWLDEFWPDSEITAMCIMFQEALQIHVLRRILKFPTDHPIVQRIVYLAMGHLERYIPPASTIQRCMTFILVTIASESLVPEHRTSLLIRLRHMGEAGFAYNWKVCDDIRRHWAGNTSLIIAPVNTLI